MNVPPTTFGQYEEKYNLKMGIVRMAILIGAAGVGFLQTSTFGAFLSGPDDKGIREHVKICNGLEAQRLVDYMKMNNRVVPDGVTYELFAPDVQAHLKRTVDSFLNDDSLQEELKNEFGTSFRDISVVVIPSWEIDTPVNNDVVGITMAGWQQAEKTKGTEYVGGYTLRERPNEMSVTVDGRPRIVLNPSAFQSERALKLTLFHEFLHAMNIQGVNPPFFCFAQDDLRYLREYRDEVSRQGLIRGTEILIWDFAVI